MSEMIMSKINQLSKQLGKCLQKKGLFLACAESCTGGLLAKVITDIPGSSAYFNYGFVTYSNEAKITLLSVPEMLLNCYGAVSEHVASAMATGALLFAQSDLAISITGIAGPDGGSKEKPVGTVCFGLATKDQVCEHYTTLFSGNRQMVRSKATLFALQLLQNKLSKKSLDTV